MELFPHPKPSGKLFSIRFFFFLLLFLNKAKQTVTLRNLSRNSFRKLFFPPLVFQAVYKPRSPARVGSKAPVFAVVTPIPHTIFLEKSGARRGSADQRLGQSHETGLLFLAQQLTWYANMSTTLHLPVTGFSLSEQQVLHALLTRKEMWGLWGDWCQFLATRNRTRSQEGQAKGGKSPKPLKGVKKEKLHQ